MNLFRSLLLCSLLAGCQTTAKAPDQWTDYVNRLEQMAPDQLQEARQMALDSYMANPDDWNRMRAAYALSRPGASEEQLSRSQEILAEITANSDLAPLRDLLTREAQRAQELRLAQARSQEYRNRVKELETELIESELKLKALLEIERKMLESQERADELQR